MTEHHHYVQHTHMLGEGILTRWECTAPDNAPCRFYPDDLETWTEEQRLEHGVQHEGCLWRVWLEDMDCGETCGPDGEFVRSGPIAVTWNGECVDWEYAETPITDTMVERAIVAQTNHHSARVGRAPITRSREIPGTTDNHKDEAAGMRAALIAALSEGDQQ